MKKLLILVFLGLNFTAAAQLDTNVLKLIKIYDKALKSCHESSNNLALIYEKYIDSLETNCLGSAEVEAAITVYDSALKSCRADYEQLTDAYFQLDSLYQDRIKTSDIIIRQERKNAKYRRYGTFFIGGFVGIITGIAIKD